MLRPTKQHAGNWIAVVALGNLPFYESMPDYTWRQWVELLYNVSSMVGLFYIIANAMSRFYNGFSPYRKLSYWRKMRYYLGNKYILCIVCCLALYVSCSAMMDIHLFNRTSPFRILAYRRTAYYGLFAIAGMYHARDSWKEKKMTLVYRASNQQNRQLKSEYQQLKEQHNALMALVKKLTG